MTTAETVANILLEIKAITFNMDKPYRYASGILSPVYTDCRLLMGHVEKRRQVIQLLAETIKNSTETFTVVAGTATAGIPHAAWVSETLNLPMIYVRGKAKDHGKGNAIEGVLKNDQHAAVIEDLISTAESSVQTVKTIREAGAHAAHIFSIFTYGMEKAKENLEANGITLASLTTFHTVVAIAEKQNLIQQDQKEKILAWAKDPTSWGKQMGFE